MARYRIEIADRESFDAQFLTLDFLGQIAVRDAVLAILPSMTDALLETNWFKHLGENLFELRLGPDLRNIARLLPSLSNHSAPHLRVLIRLFFAVRGETILLLGVYDKKSDLRRERQQAEIAAASSVLSNWLLQND